MIFLLLLPVLTAGYVTSLHHPYVRLASAREEGQRLYLRAVSLGFASMALGGSVAFTLSVLLPDIFTVTVTELHSNFREDYSFSLDLVGALSQALGETGMLNQSADEQSAWLILLSASSFLGAGLMILHAYIKYGKRAGVFRKPTGSPDVHPESDQKIGSGLLSWAQRGQEKIKLDITAELLEQSPMDRLLFLAQAKKIAVQFWMENRKVYVGMVVDCAEPFPTTGTNNEVAIVPVMSGYQNKTTLCVHFTTFYHEQSKEVVLILRQDQIRTVSEFEWDAFEALKSKPDVPVATQSGHAI